MAIDRAAHRIIGRDAESQTLQDLLGDVRAERSRAVLLRGEAGIGKSTLLDGLAEAAEGVTLLRVVGVESDMELPYAGLQQLCEPVVSERAELPAPQRQALETAFALDVGAPPNRFLVGLAVTGLLAAASRRTPLLCLVDDVQWLDAVSAQTLFFVARRITDVPVGIVFAARERPPGLSGVAELALTGLSGAESRALLAAVHAGRFDDAVRDRLVAEARGNPLALLELPMGLSGAELAGGYHRPDVQPVVGDLERHYAAVIAALPTQTRLFLLLAAAEPVGDTALLIGAARAMGMTPPTVVPAESAGLIEMGVRVRFRHPLVRSAAYRAGTVTDRRRVHAALAEATDGDADPDRRAWHRAYAVEGTDEQVAADLAASATRAWRRGGAAASAAFLTRAVELTADPVRRSERALAAAEALHEVALFESAREMLATAALSPAGDSGRARLAQLRARLALTGMRGGAGGQSLEHTTGQFIDAASHFARVDDGLAQQAYLEALSTAMYAGRHSGAVAAAASAALRGAEPAPGDPVAAMAAALAIRLTSGPAVAMPAIRESVRRVGAAFDRGASPEAAWLWRAFPIAHEVLVHEAWDDQSRVRLSQAAVRAAEQTGALTMLPAALVSQAGVHVQSGDFASARALLAECDRIAEMIGHAPVRYHALALAAWSGDEAGTARLVDGAQRDGSARGEGRLIALTAYATAVLNNGLGRYQTALNALQSACAAEDLGIYGWNLVELVEAAARADETAVAKAALEELDERTGAAGTDWALGIAARCRALLASGPEARALYEEALERLARTRVTVHLARAHLLYGEWLRRENRRADARSQLRRAFEMFTGFGAEAFADRARRELLATGEKLAKRPASAGDELTAQERQIADLVAAGMTNSEIAAQLFISAHTVEWHLRKVFTKLGITSRRQLRTRGAP